MSPRKASIVEQILVLFVFISYSYCINYPLPSRFDNPILLSIFQKGAKLIAVLLPVVFLARQPRMFLRTITQSKPLLLFFFWCSASIYWSADPLLTLKEVTLLGIVIVFSTYLACNFSLSNILFLIVGCGGLGAFLSLIMWLFYPQESWSSITLGADGEELLGFKGSYVHKNHLAFAMNVSILSLFFLWRMRQISLTLALPLLALFSFLLFCSSSAANYIGFFLVLFLCAFGFLLSEKKSSSRRYIFLAALIMIGCLVSGGSGTYHLVAKKLNRSSSLTGRTQIWKLSVYAIKKQPILGYGFNSFWPKHKDLSKFSEASTIWNKLKWSVPQAHNGYLDLVLNTGMVGAAIILGLFVIQIIQLTKMFQNANFDQRVREVAVFGLSYWILIIYINFAESFLLNIRYYYQFVLLYFVFVAGGPLNFKNIPINLFVSKTSGDGDSK